MTTSLVMKAIHRDIRPRCIGELQNVVDFSLVWFVIRVVSVVADSCDLADVRFSVGRLPDIGSYSPVDVDYGLIVKRRKPYWGRIYDLWYRERSVRVECFIKIRRRSKESDWYLLLDWILENDCFARMLWIGHHIAS